MDREHLFQMGVLTAAVAAVAGLGWLMGGTGAKGSARNPVGEHRFNVVESELFEMQLKNLLDSDIPEDDKEYSLLAYVFLYQTFRAVF